MKTDLCALSATELLALYRKKKLSPVEVVRATLERIEKLNPVLNAFCLIDEKLAKELLSLVLLPFFVIIYRKIYNLK